MYQLLYGIPLWLQCLGLLLIYTGWVWAGKRLRQAKIWRWSHFALILLWAAVILYVTIFNRSEGSGSVNLEPFWSYRLTFSKENYEFFFLIYLNIIAFSFFGLLAPELLASKWRHFAVMVIAVLLSIAIEYCQFRLDLGMAEFDDVFSNSLGAFGGVIANWAANRYVTWLTAFARRLKNRCYAFAKGGQPVTSKPDSWKERFRGIVMYQRFLKRWIDIVLSACGIALLAIPMLVIALAVKLDSKGPVLFWQKRVAIHKGTYMMPKFRSMYTTAPANMPTHMLTSPDQWITPVGRVLRKTSLDELPQLFSIFMGHMSIVGPRPALWNQDDLIAERDKYGANDVRPGLTGWAQVNGRDELSIEVKARFDGEYVQNLTFGMDCKCFFGTIAKVLKRDGVVEGGTGELEARKQKENVK